MNVRHVLAAIALAALALPARRAQQPIVIKFSHVVAVDTPKGKGAERFKELAEERTKGRVKVEVYPNSQLYKDSEEMEALQLGSVQMLAPSLAKFGPLGVREFEVFDLPYIFTDYDELHKVTDGAGRQDAVREARAQGHHGPGLLGQRLQGDEREQAAAHVPADFKGLKMRIQSSKVLDAQMRALGAIPQVMAFSEVYQALQTGVVDGTENPPSNFYTQKMHEVQKYIDACPTTATSGYAVIVNKKFWDGLPADIRTTLEGAMKDATNYANDIAKKENDDALEAMARAARRRSYTLTPAEKAEWKKALHAGAQGEWSRASARTSSSGLQGDGLQAVIARTAARGRAARVRARRGSRVKILDRLEEWLIAFLMGAATLLIFVAVVHRYAAGHCRIPVHPGLPAQDRPVAGRRSCASTCSCGWPSSARPTACAPASTSAST